MPKPLEGGQATVISPRAKLALICGALLLTIAMGIRQTRVRGL
jgi:hypothetical protein